MTYQLTVNKAQIKIISKALDIFKSVIKGEISRSAGLIAENKITCLKYSSELEECFEQRIRKLRTSLIDLENIYFDKYLNILQLGEIGSSLSYIKKKFIDIGYYINQKKIDRVSFNITDDDIKIISLATNLYYNILLGNIEFMYQIIKISYNINESLYDDLYEVREYATGLAENNLYLFIDNDRIHRKAKWCYDIHQQLNLDKIHKNIGTLQPIKIRKYDKV
jgi:hypothetical protein